MAPANYFPPPPERAALQREAKWLPGAILRSAPALRVQPVCAPGQGIAVQAQLDNTVEALSAMLTGTRIEDDLADLLWSFVNLFHRKLDRIERELLERLINQGISLIERRNAFEFARDHAAELYEAATGSAWRPHIGSMVNHRTLTASVIDSRDFLAAPFKRNDRMLEALPIGVVVFPGSGIAANLADKAKKLGIPIWRFDQPAPAKAEP
jgi:hypothetical protein